MISDSSERGNTEMSAALKPISAQPPIAIAGVPPHGAHHGAHLLPASSQVAS